MMKKKMRITWMMKVNDKIKRKKKKKKKKEKKKKKSQVNRYAYQNNIYRMKQKW